MESTAAIGDHSLREVIQKLRERQADQTVAAAIAGIDLTNLNERMFSAAYRPWRTFTVGWVAEKRLSFRDVLASRGSESDQAAFSGALVDIRKRNRNIQRVLKYSKSGVLLSHDYWERLNEYDSVLADIRSSISWRKNSLKALGAVLGAGCGLWAMALNRAAIAEPGLPLYDWKNWAILVAAFAGAETGAKLGVESVNTTYREVAGNNRLARALFKEMLITERFSQLDFGDLIHLPEDNLFANDPVFSDRTCPLTQEPILHAVKSGCCNKVFEEKAIRFWLHIKRDREDQASCPLCRGELKEDQLISQSQENAEFLQNLVGLLGEYDELRLQLQSESGVGEPGVPRLLSREQLQQIKDANSEKQSVAFSGLRDWLENN